MNSQTVLCQMKRASVALLGWVRPAHGTKSRALKTDSKRASNREYDARRRREQPWRAMYSTAQWRGMRAQQLAFKPICQRCESRGLIRAATVAHHIKAHRGDADLFFDANNLASSCTDCHDIDEQRIENGGKARQTIGPDGWSVG